MTVILYIIISGWLQRQNMAVMESCPYVITKEEEPVLVYFGYAAYEEEGYYEIYVPFRKIC